MTIYVDAPGTGPVQGIWCYPPDREDMPSYVCDRGKEGLVITDLASARRFFGEKCRWSAAGVRGLTAVTFLDGQTWRQQEGLAAWPVRVGRRANFAPRRGENLVSNEADRKP